MALDVPETTEGKDDASADYLKARSLINDIMAPDVQSILKHGPETPTPQPDSKPKETTPKVSNVDRAVSYMIKKREPGFYDEWVKPAIESLPQTGKDIINTPVEFAFGVGTFVGGGLTLAGEYLKDSSPESVAKAGEQFEKLMEVNAELSARKLGAGGETAIKAVTYPIEKLHQLSLMGGDAVFNSERVKKLTPQNRALYAAGAATAIEMAGLLGLPKLISKVNGAIESGRATRIDAAVREAKSVYHKEKLRLLRDEPARFEELVRKEEALADLRTLEEGLGIDREKTSGFELEKKQADLEQALKDKELTPQEYEARKVDLEEAFLKRKSGELKTQADVIEEGRPLVEQGETPTETKGSLIDVVEKKSPEGVIEETILREEGSFLDRAAERVGGKIEPRIIQEQNIARELVDLTREEGGAKFTVEERKGITQEGKKAVENFINKQIQGGKTAKQAAEEFTKAKNDIQSLKGKEGLQKKLQTQVDKFVDFAEEQQKRGAISGTGEETRGLSDTLTDLYELIPKAEQGGFGSGPFEVLYQSLKKFTPKQKAAFDRLGKDVTKLQKRAAKAGLTIEEMLDSMGVDDAVAKALALQAGEVSVAPEMVTKLEKLSGISSDPVVEILSAKSKVIGRFTDLDTSLGFKGKKAVNINFDNLATTSDIKAVIDEVAKIYGKGLTKAKRGVVSFKQTEMTADALGMTAEDLLARNKGYAFNDAEALAARRIVVSSAEELVARAEQYKLTGSKVDEFAMRKQLALHYALQSQLTGGIAEAARATNAMKIQAGNSKAMLRQIDDILANIPKDVPPEALAEAIASQTTPGGLTQFAKQVRRATTLDMFIEAWINGLLTGPQTHAVNALSNTLVATLQMPERAIAGIISSLRKTPNIHMGEPVAQAYGMVEGFGDVMKSINVFLREQAAKTGLVEPPPADRPQLITEQMTDLMEKVETGGTRAITAENLKNTMIGKPISGALEEGGPLARGVDFLGEVIRSPGGALILEDKLFKTLGYRMELRARALRRAYLEEGLKGEQAAKRMQSIINNPQVEAPDIHLASWDAGKYQTFTRALGEVGRHIQGIASAAPMTRIIVPFIRTPANIFKFTFERTPLAVFSENIRGSIAAGGAEADLALARVAVGSSVMGTVAYLVQKGHITGSGPSNPAMKNIKRNTGWQPNSIKIDNTYYSYSRLEPLGSLMGIAADMVEIMAQSDELEAEEAAAAMALAVAKNATSKTWLRGVSEVIKAYDDPDRYGNRYLQALLSSTIPTGVGQVERTLSPEMSAVYNLVDAMKAKVPGYSNKLPPRRNLWGDTIVLEGGWGPDLISPIYKSEGKYSPVDDELVRMDVPIRMPSKSMQYQGTAIELDPWEYDFYIQAMNSVQIGRTGKPLKESLNQMVVHDSDYVNTDNEMKENMIRGMIGEARERAKVRVVEEFPVLSALYNEARREKLRR